MVKIFGKAYHRCAKVVEIHGFSAHAGQDLLVKYAQAAKGRLKQGMRVQGEPKPAQALQSKLANAGIAPVIYPDMSQTMEF